MDIDIYTSTTRDTYVCVPAGTTPPAHTGAVAKWKTITLHPTDNRIAMDASQVLADIAKQGFAIISGGVDIG